jgi:hypothetical protein
VPADDAATLELAAIDDATRIGASTPSARSSPSSAAGAPPVRRARDRRRRHVALEALLGVARRGTSCCGTRVMGSDGGRGRAKSGA